MVNQKFKDVIFSFFFIVSKLFYLFQLELHDRCLNGRLLPWLKEQSFLEECHSIPAGMHSLKAGWNITVQNSLMFSNYIIGHTSAQIFGQSKIFLLMKILLLMFPSVSLLRLVFSSWKGLKKGRRGGLVCGPERENQRQISVDCSYYFVTNKGKAVHFPCGTCALCGWKHRPCEMMAQQGCSPKHFSCTFEVMDREASPPERSVKVPSSTIMFSVELSGHGSVHEQSPTPTFGSPLSSSVCPTHMNTEYVCRDTVYVLVCGCMPPACVKQLYLRWQAQVR